MKRYNLIAAKADKDSGISYVRIGTDLGEFEGYASCHIEDLPQFSNFFGCGIAEMRANIKYAKAKTAYYDAQFTALENYKKTMVDTRNWNPNDYYVKKLEEHLKATYHKREHWKIVRDMYETRIKERIKQRDEIIAKLGVQGDDSLYN